VCIGGLSEYNDEQGIKMTVVFTALPPPLAAGKKRRSNAKLPTITKIDYFHEEFELKDLIVKIAHLIQCDDLVGYSWLYQGEKLDTPDSFSIAYTIPRSVTNQVQISGKRDFDRMVADAIKRGSPEVKFFLVENKAMFSVVLDLIY
jgi:hypothetical protein